MIHANRYWCRQATERAVTLPLEMHELLGFVLSHEYNVIHFVGSFVFQVLPCGQAALRMILSGV